MSWLSWSVLSLVGVVFIADVFGHSFYHSFWSNYERMDGFLTLLHVTAYYFIASSVLNTKERWRLFFNISIFASIIMAFYTFLQLAGKIQINQGGVRIDGTFGNATYLAVYMLFNIFITLLLSLGVYERGVKNKWPLYGWYGLALVCQLITLYYTATRGAILALFGGLILTALGIALFEKHRPMVRKMGIGLLILVALVVGGFFAARNTNFVTNSPTLGRFSSLSLESINNQGRRFVWPMAWQGFKDRPILGWGQENFNYVFNKYYDPRMYNQEPWFDRAHNIVLDWLVTTGIVGFLAYMSLFVGALFLIWKNKEFSLGQKSLLVGLLGAYFFQNLFVFDNLISYVYFFSLLAFIHSESVRNKNAPQWIERLSNNKAISQAAIPTIAIILVVVSVYTWNVKQIGANRDIIRALDTNGKTTEQSLGYFKAAFDANTFATGEATDQMIGQFNAFNNQNISEQTRREFAVLLIENLDKTITRFPDDARYLLSMGGIRTRMGDVSGAKPYLIKALELTPKKQRAYYEIGFSELTAGNYVVALDYFKTAYELEKTSSESKVLYAIAALYAKQNKLGTSFLEFICSLKVIRATT
jgi:O-antigen ligase